MNLWNFVELDDGLEMGGFTEDGYPTTIMTISGWNDDEEFSDAETLVTITGIEKENEIEIQTKYESEEIQASSLIQELVVEATEEILKWIRNKY